MQKGPPKRQRGAKVSDDEGPVRNRQLMDWRRMLLKMVQMVAFQLQIQKVRVRKAPGPSGAMKQIMLKLAQLLKIGDLEELQIELGGVIQQRNLLEAQRASRETAKMHQG